MVYSEQLGHSHRFAYSLQIRLFQNFEFGLAWLQSSGQGDPDGCRHTVLEDAALELVQAKRSFYMADAEDQEEACAIYEESMRLAA